MSEASPVRLTLREGEVRRAFLDDLVAQTSVSRVEAHELIEGASKRLRRTLRVKDPLRLRGSALQPVACAGLIRLAPGIELEVVPKFLRANDRAWREDFFLLATLSKVGRVFPADMIRAGHDDRGDFASLVGQAMLLLFWKNHREPLRTYHRVTVRDFAYGGDVDPEELVLPDASGFRQEVVLLDRSNPYNGSILRAARSLLPEVRDSETRMQLVRMVELLAPQGSALPGRVPKRVPSRHRAWQSLYDLALHVLSGFGAGFDATGLYGPGFVLKTWQAWEDLLLMAVRIGLHDFDVLAQHPYRLGTRKRVRTRAFRVHPDIALREKHTGRDVLLLDAKYKARISRGRIRVAEADLYEALAFMRASSCRQTLLLYPRLSTGEPRQPGECAQLEAINAQGHEVRALEVECQGVARAGLRSFAETLTGEFRAYLP